MWKTKYLQFFSEVVCNQDNVPLLINHGIIQEKTKKHGISTQRLVDLAIVVKLFLKNTSISVIVKVELYIHWTLYIFTINIT